MNSESKKPGGIKTYFRNLRSSLACVCVACALLLVALGQGRQSKSVNPQRTTPTDNSTQRSGNQSGERSQVEVNKDRFGGATRVVLKPQLILDTPDHQLSVSAEAKLEGKKQIGIFQEDQSVQLTFISQSKVSIDFGDQELHFLVDGERVTVGKTSGGTGPYLGTGTPSDSGFKFRKRFFAVLDLSKLRRIAEGKKVEMRLGKIELTLDPKLLSNLRAFVTAASSE